MACLVKFQLVEVTAKELLLQRVLLLVKKPVQHHCAYWLVQLLALGGKRHRWTAVISPQVLASVTSCSYCQ